MFDGVERVLMLFRFLLLRHFCADRERRAAAVLSGRHAAAHLRGDQSAAQSEVTDDAPSSRRASRSAAWSSTFEHVLPKSQAEVSVILQRLQPAGFRNESAVKIFYGSKVLVPVLLCVLALITGLASLVRFSFILCAWAWDFWCRISGWAGGLLSAKARSGAGCLMFSICWSSVSKPD